jgi:hypothetical protein
MVEVRATYQNAIAGECSACLDMFDHSEIAVLSCGHYLHPTCAENLYLAARDRRPRCPFRCGNIRPNDIRTTGAQAHSNARWPGEADPEEIEFLRLMRDERNLTEERAADLAQMEALLLRREA